MMSGCSGSIVRGLIQRRSLNFTCSTVNKIETFWTEYYKGKSFSTSSNKFTDKQKDEDDPCKGKDVYKVSPLCAPKGFRFKGEITSLKCPPKVEVQEKPSQKPSGQTKASDVIQKPSHKVHCPAQATPLVDGKTPVTTKNKGGPYKDLKCHGTKQKKSGSFFKKLIGSKKKKGSKKKNKADCAASVQEKSQPADSPKQNSAVSPAPTKPGSKPSCSAKSTTKSQPAQSQSPKPEKSKSTATSKDCSFIQNASSQSKQKCSPLKVVIPESICPQDSDNKSAKNQIKPTQSQINSNKCQKITDESSNLLEKTRNGACKSESKLGKKENCSKGKSGQDSESESTPPAKPPCLNSRKEINAKCPDPKEFETQNKGSVEPEEKIPCSILPWPFNIFDEKRKSNKPKKGKCKQETKKSKQGNNVKIVSILDYQMPNFMLPLNLKDAPFLNTSRNGKSIHTSTFKNSSGPVCPREKPKKCGDLVKNNQMEEAMMKLRASARYGKQKKMSEAVKISLLPPDDWERDACEVTLGMDKKKKNNKKVYDVPRLVGRKLRRKKVC